MRVVTSQPIVVQVIAETEQLVPGVDNRFYVYTSYPDGRPAETRVTVHGVAKEIETNRFGIGVFEVNPTEISSGLTLRAIDSQGLVGRAHKSIATSGAAGDFLIRPDKSVYRGGETMTLVALGGGSEPVFVDLMKDDQAVLTQTIEISPNTELGTRRGELQFDLPPDLFGTIEVVAYRYGPSGLAVRRSRVVYVEQARELNVRATLDKDEYRPGSQAKLRLSLSDAEGQAVAGAISLAAVDEAVFSVLSQSTGLAETFFLLEQELLEPVFEIYNWSPDSLRGDDLLVERQQFENALFATTASQDASPFSLAAATYETKAAATQNLRSRGLRATNAAWIGLVIVLACCGAVLFAMARPKIFAWTAGVLVAGVLVVGLLLPAVQSVRESARPTNATANWDGAVDAEMDFAATAEMAEESMMLEAAPTDYEHTAATPPRVRQWFPETLLWRPELITDDNGVAEIDVELADSITTWRLSASGVSAAGQLGAAEFPLRVFLPFFVDLNLPVALTRNDEVAVPVVVYNYLDEPQTVEIELDRADWFEFVSGEDSESATPLVQQLQLGPGEVRSLSYPIRVTKVGKQTFQVTARAAEIADAVRREIEVVPDGRRVATVESGSLSEPFEMTFEVPAEAIEGSAAAIVKLYPSTFSQLVEGLDSIFRMPSGCFEQTSSTTYPNVLALDYLRRTDKSAAAVEAKARQYIHVGYQRLVSFEVPGGGFDWFGNPPANVTLTAYGLMEFRDMAAVHDVDPNLIAQTRRWLLDQRGGDGAWKNEAGMLNDGLAGSVQRGNDLNLGTTAYVAWSVFGGSSGKDSEADATLDYLLSRRPASIDNPYLVAMVACAIAAINPNEPQLDSWLARLDAMKQTSEDGKKVWWQQAAGGQTAFYGSGQSGDIETTALAVLAMTASGKHRGTTRQALTWLVEQKDEHGTWHSTQATVLALKALLAGTDAPLGGETPREIQIAVNGQIVHDVDIPVDQADVMQQFNLTDLVTKPGTHVLKITELSDAGTGFQVAARYHVESPPEVESAPALTIDINYDRARLTVDDRVTCVANVVNNLPETAPMVIVDLPIPGGFTIEPGELAELVGSGKIAKYQITPRKAIVYLRELAPAKPLELRYRLRATMPVKVAVPPAQAYHYYDPDKRGTGGEFNLEATVGV